MIEQKYLDELMAILEYRGYAVSYLDNNSKLDEAAFELEKQGKIRRYHEIGLEITWVLVGPHE